MNVRFDDFEADLASGRLWRGGEPVRLQDLPFRLLAALLERPGEVRTRADLGRRLWPDGTFVDVEAGLNTAVAKLRDALGDRADAPRFVETVPKRGYRWLAPVSGAPPASPGAAPAIVSDVAAARAPGSTLDLAAVPGRSRSRSPWGIAAALTVAVSALVWWSQPARVTRVAVVTFDNETGQPEFDRIAQNLTDSTVLGLGNDRRLAVIGNAAILRTARGFRDLVTIRHQLDVDLIVVGQVQRRPDGVRVMAHLIRASDQAHVWVQATPMAGTEDSRTEARVVGGITAAVQAARDGERPPAPPPPDPDRAPSASSPSSPR